MNSGDAVPLQQGGGRAEIGDEAFERGVTPLGVRGAENRRGMDGGDDGARER